MHALYLVMIRCNFNLLHLQITIKDGPSVYLSDGIRYDMVWNTTDICFAINFQYIPSPILVTYEFKNC